MHDIPITEGSFIATARQKSEKKLTIKVYFFGQRNLSLKSSWKDFVY